MNQELMFGMPVSGRTGNITSLTAGENLTIELVQRLREASPCAVKLGEKPLWLFKNEITSLGAEKMISSKLVVFENEPFILITSRACNEKGYIEKLIAVRDLPSHVPAMMGGVVIAMGGRQAVELLRIKRELAKNLHLNCMYTQTEQVILLAEQHICEQKALVEQEAAAAERLQQQAAIQAQRQADKDARNLARQKRRERILARNFVSAYFENGEKVNALPVTEDEKHSLPAGKAAISVSSFDDETGKCGDMISFFFVKRDGAKVTKDKERPVTSEPPAAIEAKKEAVVVQEVKMFMVERGRKAAKKAGQTPAEAKPEMAFVVDAAGFKQLKGMNHSTLVAVPVVGKDPNTFTLYEMQGETVKTVGIHQALA